MSDGAIEPSVRSPKTAELIARRLRFEIVTGELKDGDTLPPESEMLTRFGVSRPTLREAIRILESEGLLSVRRGARDGARVHRPSEVVAARYAGWVLQSNLATISNMHEARQIIETNAVALAAERRTAEDLANLRELSDQAEAAVDEPARSLAVLEKFHRELVRASRNPTLALLGAIIDEVLLRTAVDPQRLPNAATLEEAFAEHRAALELIEQGDRDGVEQFWLAHLRRTTERDLAAMDPDAKVDVMRGFKAGLLE